MQTRKKPPGCARLPRQLYLLYREPGRSGLRSSRRKAVAEQSHEQAHGAMTAKNRKPTFRRLVSRRSTSPSRSQSRLGGRSKSDHPESFDRKKPCPPFSSGCE